MKKTKALKTLYYGANMLVPLTEGRRVVRAMAYAITSQRDRLRSHRQARTAENEQELTFDAAVKQSGQTVPALLGQYRLRKQVWLALGILPVLAAAVLDGAAFSAGFQYGELAWRLLTLNFMLAGFTGLTVVRAMQCQYRCWQLQTRQLGTFARWRRETRWLTSTLRFRG